MGARSRRRFGFGRLGGKCDGGRRCLARFRVRRPQGSDGGRGCRAAATAPAAASAAASFGGRTLAFDRGGRSFGRGRGRFRFHYRFLLRFRHPRRQLVGYEIGLQGWRSLTLLRTAARAFPAATHPLTYPLAHPPPCNTSLALSAMYCAAVVLGNAPPAPAKQVLRRAKDENCKSAPLSSAHPHLLAGEAGVTIFGYRNRPATPLNLALIRRFYGNQSRH